MHPNDPATSTQIKIFRGFLSPITNYESIPRLQAALDASSAVHSKIPGQLLPTEHKIEHKCSNSFLCCVLLHVTSLHLAYLHQKDERVKSGKFLINKILFPTSPPNFCFKKVFPVTKLAAFYSTNVSSYILSIRSTYLSSSYVTASVIRNGCF